LSVPLERLDSNYAPAVLLVEDEPTLSHVLARILTEEGFDVTQCDSGLDALDFVRGSESRIDLVISDVGLPGLRGDRLAAELLKVRPTMPILLMTGYSEVVAPGNKEALGVAGVLQKPITIEVLLAAVRDALRLGGASRRVTCR